MSRGYAAYLPTSLGGKGVADTMEQELEQALSIRLAVGQEKPGGRRSLHRAMRRREAQAEGVSQLLKREPRPEGELEGHNEILGIELHVPSMLSSFWKMEWQLSRPG